MQATITVEEHPNPLLLTFPQNIPQRLSLLSVELLEQEKSLKPRKAVLIRGDHVTYMGRAASADEPQLMLGMLEGDAIRLFPAWGQFTMQQYLHKQMGTNKSLVEQNAGETQLSHFQQQMQVAEEMGTSKSKRKMRAMVRCVTDAHFSQETNRVQEENISHATQIQELFTSKKDELKEKAQSDQHEQEA